MIPEKENIHESVKKELLKIYVSRIIRIINKNYSERLESANNLVTYKKIDKQQLEKDLIEISTSIIEVEFKDAADYIIMLNNHKEFSEDYDPDVIDFKVIEIPEINQFYQKLISNLSEEVRKNRVEISYCPDIELMYIKKIIPTKKEYLDLNKRVIPLDDRVKPKEDYTKREFELLKIIHKAKDDMIEEIARVVYG